MAVNKMKKKTTTSYSIQSDLIKRKREQKNWQCKLEEIKSLSRSLGSPGTTYLRFVFQCFLLYFFLCVFLCIFLCVFLCFFLFFPMIFLMFFPKLYMQQIEKQNWKLLPRLYSTQCDGKKHPSIYFIIAWYIFFLLQE